MFCNTPACRAAFSTFGGSGAVRAEGDVFRNGIAEQDDFSAARSRCCGANAKDPSVGCSRRPPEWRRTYVVHAAQQRGNGRFARTRAARNADDLARRVSNEMFLRAVMPVSG